jgi:hypothetical protein
LRTVDESRTLYGQRILHWIIDTHQEDWTRWAQLHRIRVATEPHVWTIGQDFPNIPQQNNVPSILWWPGLAQPPFAVLPRPSRVEHDYAEIPFVALIAHYTPGIGPVPLFTLWARYAYATQTAALQWTTSPLGIFGAKIAVPEDFVAAIAAQHVWPPDWPPPPDPWLPDPQDADPPRRAPQKSVRESTRERPRARRL